MKISTIILYLLLCISLLSVQSCKSTAIPESNEDIQKELARKRKKEARAQKRLKKQEYKHFWSLQSKETKKSIRKNKRRQKRIARKRRK